MRIAVIQRFLPSKSRGGAGHFTHGLCNALVDRGHQVTVFSQDSAPAGAKYSVVTLGHHSGWGRRYLAPLVFPFEVAKVDFSGFDVIHAQGDDHLLPRRGHTSWVRTLHGSAFAEAVHNGLRLGSIKRLLIHLYFYACEWIASCRADRVVAVSKDTCRYYPRIHCVIPNGVDIGLFHPSKEVKSPHPSILFVGELNTRKRGRLLLKTVLQEIHPRLPEVELWLVCAEETRGVGIRWFGAVDAERLSRLYREAWVFCMPSSYEGFGRPYLEAMAAGTAVIATINPGAMEVLDCGKYGLLVSERDLGDALYTLLTQENMRQEYRRKGLERAKEYRWERVAEQYESMYQEALHERRTRQHAP